MNGVRSDPEIRPVARALDILGAFDYEHQELGITQLAHKLCLQKNNIFRLLATLETRGYVEQDKKKRTYRLGLKTFEIGNVFLQQLGIRRQARPILEDLSRQSDETSYLAVLDGPDVVYLLMHEGTHSMKPASRLGRRFPAYCTAAGKCQLAFESRDKLDEMFCDLPLGSRTEKSIVHYDDILTHLRAVACQGYATEDEECDVGVRSVAAPIRDYAHRVIAAVAVSGPSSRVPPDRIDTELVPVIREAAARISQRLGYETPVKTLASGRRGHGLIPTSHPSQGYPGRGESCSGIGPLLSRRGGVGSRDAA